ncbi:MULTISPECIES: McrC family protein [Streptomyces]|uniref:Uncharacterized protein n=2 Tax=Streptomyces TaxID=1883 RepID=A0ABN1T132_9ACTN|nr:McrC family protein [Streptomyces sp. F-3]
MHRRARLSDVTPVVQEQRLPDCQPPRPNSRYHHALQSARAVLDGSSAERAPGGLRVDGFLFAPNKFLRTS